MRGPVTAMIEDLQIRVDRLEKLIRNGMLMM